MGNFGDFLKTGSKAESVFGKHKQQYGRKRPSNKYELQPLPNPANDGVTHINISMEAKTKLGKALNAGNYGFEIPGLGMFSNIHAFWLYVGTTKPLADYRTLPIKVARSKIYTTESVKQEGFVEYIKDGYRQMFNQNEELRKALIESELPFECYRVERLTAGDKTVDSPKRIGITHWFVSIMEALRKEFSRDAIGLSPDYTPVLDRVAATIESVVEPALSHETLEVNPEEDVLLQALSSTSEVSEEHTEEVAEHVDISQEYASAEEVVVEEPQEAVETQSEQSDTQA